jgi:hypothetical protein
MFAQRACVSSASGAKAHAARAVPARGGAQRTRASARTTMYSRPSSDRSAATTARSGSAKHDTHERCASARARQLTWCAKRAIWAPRTVHQRADVRVRRHGRQQRAQRCREVSVSVRVFFVVVLLGLRLLLRRRCLLRGREHVHVAPRPRARHHLRSGSGSA